MSAPVIGAALGVSDLPTYRDWLFEKDRDLELQSFWQAEALADGSWRPLAEEANKHLDGFKGRLGIHGPFWGLSFSNFDFEIREIVRRRMMAGLDVCEALGATQMVVHSPITTWDHFNMAMYPDGWERTVELTHDCLDPVIARAEDQGVELVLENIEDADPEKRKRLVETFDSKAFRLSIDTGHAHYAHGRTGAPPVDYFVRSAGNMLAHVHLQDAEGYADRHWAIGRGTIRWHAVFAALTELESNPRLILELRDRAEIPESMAFLEREGLGQ
ncbi:sugar phosphate isomerase/epimerase [Pseudoruegeria sp. HB172150]|uniref:sugar phosphate isomerase/epimerase family protein n=1 Tax=Pseudoruegeria sp. HB172150 TaxID=2721164 RepID=UPI001557B664|nr:sugar phosphate isomerase/epimerase family protein [Pseudoruegeria sp. HB172150]